MKYFRLLEEGINVTPLIAEINAHPELWDENPFRRIANNSPMTQMTDIWVRYNDVAPFKQSGDFGSFNDEHIPVWYPAWEKLPSLRLLIFDLMAKVQGEMLGGVLITRIPPGCGIGRHKDKSWHVDYYDKFYLSLMSEPGANFFCGDEMINPKAGDMYLFDNREEHWIENGSEEDRMTLITCIRTEMFGRR